jgi:hypothetical protein
MAGWFDFVNGQTLPASRVQDYLMDQSVMVFADAAARTAALPSPTNGMVTYLSTPGELYVCTNLAWQRVVDALNYGRVLPARGNAIINGGFDIWQRGTSFALGAPSASQYSADRWLVYSPATSQHTASRQTAGLDGFRFALRFQRNSGSTNTNLTGLYYGGETAESVRFANQSVTLSFYARRGANYSPTANALSASIITGTGTDQNIINGWTGASTIGNASVTLSTTWTRFTVTATVGSTATQLGVFFNSVSTGTAGANDWYEITGVQLEAGSVATPFVRAGGTLQGELAACERYFQVMSSQTFSGANANVVYGGLSFRTQMRTGPSVSLSAPMVVTDSAADYTQSSANISISVSRTNSTGAQVLLGNFTGITTHRPYFATILSSQIQLSAEL